MQCHVPNAMNVAVGGNRLLCRAQVLPVLSKCMRFKIFIWFAKLIQILPDKDVSSKN
jgi:hypothetical protein